MTLPSGEVAHALSRSLAVEVAALQMGQGGADSLHLADGRHLLDVAVDETGDVHGDVAAIALSPTVLPKIASHFCDFLYFLFEGRPAIK